MLGQEVGPLWRGAPHVHAQATESHVVKWRRGHGRPLVMAYLYGPRDWYETQWNMDVRLEDGRPGWAELRSEDITVAKPAGAHSAFHTTAQNFCQAPTPYRVEAVFQHIFNNFSANKAIAESWGDDPLLPMIIVSNAVSEFTQPPQRGGPCSFLPSLLLGPAPSGLAAVTSVSFNLLNQAPSLV